MGKHRTLEERLDQARKMADRNAKSAERHHRASQRAATRGEEEKAEKSNELYHRAMRLERHWLSQADTMERSIATVKVLTGRAPTPPLQGREAPMLNAKQQREKDKRDRLAKVEAETKRKRFAAANIDHDPRTASGKRTYHIASLGPSLRASVSHFDAVFRDKKDRTDSRLLAWSYFEDHCRRFHASLLPNQRYEPGVDSSRVPQVSEARLIAAGEDRELQAALGRDMYGLLLEVIYNHRSFADIARTTGGDREGVGFMFRRALDLAAAHYRVGEDKTYGRYVKKAMERADR
jgi:hypothetical protein